MLKRGSKERPASWAYLIKYPGVNNLLKGNKRAVSLWGSQGTPLPLSLEYPGANNLLRWGSKGRPAPLGVAGVFPASHLLAAAGGTKKFERKVKTYDC